jgi:two-component system, OmpR family, alkaline phosphatase synthesis response regulator PhoP
MKTVVILDKDDFFREFQVFLLSKRGYRVVTPDRSEDFTHEWVRRQDPDILVTEVILPGGNGFDLVRKLRETPGARCAIIVYTVLGAEARALAAGADLFIQKPLLRDAYLSAIRDLTKGEP